MTTEERFEAVNDDFLKFDRVEIKISQRRDVHVFMVLDGLFYGDEPLINWGGHDEIGFSITDEQVESLSNAQVLELVRCGVTYNCDSGGLGMWV